MRAILSVLSLVCWFCIFSSQVHTAYAADLEGGNCPNAHCVAGCGDVNADGQILATDARAILFMAVGLEVPEAFDCQFDNEECREDDSDSE